MGFLKDAWDFERNKVKNMGRAYKKDPERLVLGINTGWESKIWGKILGKHYDPTLDNYGGASKTDYSTAEQRGIDTKAGKTMHGIARTIASFFAMRAAGNAYSNYSSGTAANTGAAGAESGSGAAEASTSSVIADNTIAGATDLSASGAGGGGATSAGTTSELMSATNTGTSVGANSGNVADGWNSSVANNTVNTPSGYTVNTTPATPPESGSWFSSLSGPAQAAAINAGAGAIKGAFEPNAEDIAKEQARLQRENQEWRFNSVQPNFNVSGIDVGRPSEQPLRDSNGNIVKPVSSQGFIRDAEGNLIPQSIQPRGFIINAMSPR